jgi:hypothetical protein
MILDLLIHGCHLILYICNIHINKGVNKEIRLVEPVEFYLDSSRIPWQVRTSGVVGIFVARVGLKPPSPMQTSIDNCPTNTAARCHSPILRQSHYHLVDYEAD